MSSSIHSFSHPGEAFLKPHQVLGSVLGAQHAATHITLPASPWGRYDLLLFPVYDQNRVSGNSISLLCSNWSKGAKPVTVTEREVRVKQTAKTEAYRWQSEEGTCRRDQHGPTHGSHSEGGWQLRGQVTGEPKATDGEILTAENNIRQDLMAYGPHVLGFCGFAIVSGGRRSYGGGSFYFLGEVFGPRFTEVPVYSVGNRRARSKPDSLGSVLFSTSLITTFLPFGHGPSSPFP